MILVKLMKLKGEKNKKTKKVKNLAVSATVGVAVRVVSGVLLAPKSGKETRKI